MQLLGGDEVADGPARERTEHDQLEPLIRRTPDDTGNRRSGTLCVGSSREIGKRDRPRRDAWRSASPRRFPARYVGCDEDHLGRPFYVPCARGGSCTGADPLAASVGREAPSSGAPTMRYRPPMEAS